MILEELKKLNDKLNSWDYGVLINGAIYTDSNKIDWTKYKTIPIRLIEKYHVGICWDFVNYQHYIFKNMKLNNRSFLLIGVQKDGNIVTHTFSILNLENKLYWFESSWLRYQGIHQIKNIKSVANKVIEAYKLNNWDLFEYNPEGLDNNLTGSQFIDKAQDKLIDSSRKSVIKESKDASQIKPGFKKSSKLHFETIDLYDNKALNYISEKWRENNKIGEIAICKEDNRLAGYCLCNKSGTIAPLYVYENYRGFGLSEILMKDIISKYNGYILGVYDDNEVAIRLYKKLGFVEIRRKKYKDGDIVIIMQLKSTIK